jgi:hypothetical protein
MIQIRRVEGLEKGSLGYNLGGEKGWGAMVANITSDIILQAGHGVVHVATPHGGSLRGELQPWEIILHGLELGHFGDNIIVMVMMLEVPVMMMMMMIIVVVVP